MTDILKSLLCYALMLAAFALMIFTIGCNTENPLCSQNYCVSGEVFLRSQLLEDEEFSEVNVVEQSLLAAFANVTPQIPVETTPAPAETEVSIMDIINDAGAGNETYLNKTVTITATVVFKSEDGTGLIIYKNANLLEASRESAGFAIASLNDPEPLAKYTEGNTYTFTVRIALILPPDEDRNTYSIGAVLAE